MPEQDMQNYTVTLNVPMVVQVRALDHEFAFTEARKVQDELLKKGFKVSNFYNAMRLESKPVHARFFNRRR